MPDPLHRLCALAVVVNDTLDARLVDAVGLGGSAPAALLSIAQEPGLTVDEVAVTVGVTGSGAVRLLDRLQAEGLVERRPGADGRARHLHLTRAGTRVARRALAARNAALDDLLAPLDPDERRVLTRLVDRLLRGAVTDPAVADRTCRLCDLADCPDGTCPFAELRPRS